MATAAYVAVQDGGSTMEYGADIDHDFSRFDAPGLNAGRRPVLSFRLNPIGSEDITLEMTLNDTVILTHTFDSTEGRVWQEVVESNILRTNDNELKAALADSDRAGGIVISDVVLLYTNS